MIFAAVPAIAQWHWSYLVRMDPDAAKGNDFWPATGDSGTTRINGATGTVAAAEPGRGALS